MNITDILYIVPEEVQYQELFLYLVRNGINPFWIPEKNSFLSFITNYKNIRTILIDEGAIEEDFTIIQKIKFSPKTANCGVIFIAANEEAAHKAKFLGADYVLMKPFSSDKVFFSIKEVLSAHNFFAFENDEGIQMISKVSPSFLMNFNKISTLSKIYQNLRVYIFEVQNPVKSEKNELMLDIIGEIEKFMGNQMPLQNRYLIFPFTENDFVLLIFYPESFSKNIFLELTKDIEDIIIPKLGSNNQNYTYGFSDTSFEVAHENIELSIYSMIKKAYEVIWDTKKNRFSKYIGEFSRIIKNQDVWTEFQPIVDLDNRYEIIAYEALSRGPANTMWQAPEFLFEMGFKFDKIEDLELLCIKKSMEKFKYIKNNRMLFVNIHPHAFESVVSTLTSLKKSRPDFDIVLEITEKKFIQDFHKFVQLFKKIKSEGIKIALDDVGSGYSSLQYLVELEVDFVKIDRSLIADIHKNFIKDSVVKALISICRNIDAKIIAEGIEKKEELEVVKKLGIQYGQGYLFARPSINLETLVQYRDD